MKFFQSCESFLRHMIESLLEYIYTKLKKTGKLKTTGLQDCEVSSTKDSLLNI